MLGPSEDLTDATEQDMAPDAGPGATWSPSREDEAQVLPAPQGLPSLPDRAEHRVKVVDYIFLF